jgi:hypothetical protein
MRLEACRAIRLITITTSAAAAHGFKVAPENSVPRRRTAPPPVSLQELRFGSIYRLFVTACLIRDTLIEMRGLRAEGVP